MIAPIVKAAHGLIFLTPVLLVMGARLGAFWTLLPIAYVYLFLPLVDELRGDGPESGPPAPARLLADAPLLVWVPTQVLTTTWVLQWVAASYASGWEGLGLAISLGVMNGSAGINIAHEFMHRKERSSRAIAEGLMTWVSYPHFCIEHVLGHHRNVATPLDPATSRLGESVYRFYFRSLVGGLRGAWHLERDLLNRAGRRAWTLSDRRLRYPLVLSTLYVLVAASWGGLGLALFIAQGVVAFTMLEIVNYLEHYGLQRRQIEGGRYERVTPRHSWNSNRSISNAFLFNLARHSDHHHVASRPYDELRSVPDAPQLPAGYPAMILMALVPPLWFKVMNPRVLVERDGATMVAEPAA